MEKKVIVFYSQQGAGKTSILQFIGSINPETTAFTTHNSGSMAVNCDKHTTLVCIDEHSHRKGFKQLNSFAVNGLPTATGGLIFPKFAIAVQLTTEEALEYANAFPLFHFVDMTNTNPFKQ